MEADNNRSHDNSDSKEAFKLRYICHQCRVEFELPITDTAESGREVKCPECDIRDYICHRCRSLFELLVPRGPKEEKAAKCPECGSVDISRINVGHSEVCPPGG
jgi:DNA-directed RNA polymerase subunit RPC12/RpoP